jgi:hypothetical protein
MAKHELEITVERAWIEPGRSLSQDAIDETIQKIALFIGQSIWDDWEAEGRPPTRLDILITVEGS